MSATATILVALLCAPPQNYTVDQKLVIAAFELDVDKVRTLLANGANPNARMGVHDRALFEDKWTLAGSPLGSHEWTPLMAVASSHRAPQPETRAQNTVAGLDAAREKLNAIDPKLIRLRDDRRIEIAKTLMAAKADLDLDDGYGATPLSISVYQHYGPLALLLISAGANVNTKTSVYIDGADHITPVHRATDQPAVLEALIRHGARVNVADSEGDTPLHWAVLEHNLASVRLLLAAGADPSAQNRDGRVPAYWCRTHVGISAPEDANAKEILRLLQETAASK